MGGFASLGEHKVMVIGTQKGRDTKENIMRNFGSAHPEGYRKALRLMKLADKFRLPIITLVDTAGAYPGIGAEERHIAEAIAVNLREMMLFEVPIIAAIIGEGGSGGGRDCRRRLPDRPPATYDGAVVSPRHGGSHARRPAFGRPSTPTLSAAFSNPPRSPS